MRGLELSAPHNWCDRRCERCPLAGECPLPGATRSLDEALADAERMLREICEEEGISVDDAEPPPPIAASVDDQVLERAAMDWTGALHAVLPRDPRMLLVGGKVARVISMARSADDELWDFDIVPNLLLLERLLADLDADVARRAPPPPLLQRYHDRTRTLRGLLAPWFDRIDAAHRAIFAALIAGGRAPSPFCRRTLC